MEQSGRGLALGLLLVRPIVHQRAGSHGSRAGDSDENDDKVGCLGGV
jgi:hypothetical protein